MLTNKDKVLLNSKGITISELYNQIYNLKEGFPYLKIVRQATIGDGIFKLTDTESDKYINSWERYSRTKKQIVKFVPASGAATRMFKDLFTFLSSDEENFKNENIKTFFDNIKSFAFYDELNIYCQYVFNKSIEQLISANRHKDIIDLLLGDEGLNYGQMPKGVLAFHSYKNGYRTPVEEHLVEAAMYCKQGNKARIHFTVSGNHLDLFKSLVNKTKSKYEEKYNLNFDIDYSVQKSSTDTVALNMDNTLFRSDDGMILFRPSGHGALIENLNDINADIVFIKNIDNVVPDRLKQTTVYWKKVIAGILVELQTECFKYIRLLKTNDFIDADIVAATEFVHNKLCCNLNIEKCSTIEDKVELLLSKLNRPIRVCGMVKNSGEPGGGPFYIMDNNGNESLQIIENAQINKNDNRTIQIFKHGTHFNPVDLVCGIKDYRGIKFDLLNFVDKNTGFVSIKSKGSKQLKALERPGLWNGAMSNWNTVFIEVPVITFNPVKTVTDLLRSEHQ